LKRRPGGRKIGFLLSSAMPFPTAAMLSSKFKPALSALWLLATLVPAAVQAQYKIVRPDGSVTYTDRPPSEANVRIIPIGRIAGQTSGDNVVPAELRQAVARYPVTLYTTAECTPCDSGRKLLQLRGIPYTERRITTEEDALALERAVGGRTVPALNVGAQPVRGYSEADWMAFLDSAGYPKESKLPRNWPVPTPTPLVERAAAQPVRAAAPAAPAAPAAAEPEPPAQGTSIRF
jgi:glutaredoxin